MMQVDGYSLDAQREKLRKYADYQDMVIAGEYSDEGHSGKNIKGRSEFTSLLADIESGKPLLRQLYYNSWLMTSYITNRVLGLSFSINEGRT